MDGYWLRILTCFYLGSRHSAFIISIMLPHFMPTYILHKTDWCQNHIKFDFLHISCTLLSLTLLVKICKDEISKHCLNIHGAERSPERKSCNATKFQTSEWITLQKQLCVDIHPSSEALLIFLIVSSSLLHPDKWFWPGQFRGKIW